MIFHADSEFDLKTSLNLVQKPILLKIRFLQNLFFKLVWGGFEVGFGISVKNHADP